VLAQIVRRSGAILLDIANGKVAWYRTLLGLVAVVRCKYGGHSVVRVQESGGFTGHEQMVSLLLGQIEKLLLEILAIISTITTLCIWACRNTILGSVWGFGVKHRTGCHSSGFLANLGVGVGAGLLASLGTLHGG